MAVASIVIGLARDTAGKPPRHGRAAVVGELGMEVSGGQRDVAMARRPEQERLRAGTDEHRRRRVAHVEHALDVVTMKSLWMHSRVRTGDTSFAGAAK